MSTVLVGSKLLLGAHTHYHTCLNLNTLQWEILNSSLPFQNKANNNNNDNVTDVKSGSKNSSSTPVRQGESGVAVSKKAVQLIGRAYTHDVSYVSHVSVCMSVCIYVYMFTSPLKQLELNPNNP